MESHTHTQHWFRHTKFHGFERCDRTKIHPGTASLALCPCRIIISFFSCPEGGRNRGFFSSLNSARHREREIERRAVFKLAFEVV